jgi:branched-chain amino acid transport system ATP-binding protein
VDGVSMKVPSGQRCAILGPNGAGKTTLFNCITGTLISNSGKIYMFEKEVTRLTENKRVFMGVGRTFQITNVFSKLTVLENILLAVQGTKKQKWAMHRSITSFSESKAIAEKELDRVGLAHLTSHPVQHLSYGECRQLEFALAMACRPRLLLLDEPASGLSPGERQRIAEIISQLPRDITIILIEHDMGVALELADQVAVLHRGRIIFEGTPDQVQSNSKVREVYFGDV